MTSKIFRCSQCGVFLGEMEKGRIKKDAVCLCATCETSRKLMAASKKATGGPLDDLFNGEGGIFGGGL